MIDAVVRQVARVVLIVALVAIVALGLLAFVAGRLTAGERSSKWPEVRASHLKSHPECEACGERRAKFLAVHHIVPFHVDASKELAPENLITLCEGESVNCHLLFGHLRNWRSWNVDVRKDAAEWRAKIKNRPMPARAK
jgi:5-methylcytosine-specific restriction enzyme A